MDFGGLSAINATFLNDTGLLDDATRYPSCVTENFRSVVLKDTALNIAIVVYYNGTTPGSRACFICDGRELNTTINERVCQTDATWSESPVTCGMYTLLISIHMNVTLYEDNQRVMYISRMTKNALSHCILCHSTYILSVYYQQHS